jgi:glyoxylase-like metal-dependent hydrolase (beta-lactamase superfamily II)
MLFDVGHGDSLLLSDHHNQNLLVDCGSSRPQKHLEVPQFIESYLPTNCSSCFIVSHYHYDHYSLFQWFKRPDLLFSKVYVPFLPSTDAGSNVGQAIMRYLSVAVLANYSFYRVLPDIFQKTKAQIIPC